MNGSHSGSLWSSSTLQQYKEHTREYCRSGEEYHLCGGHGPNISTGWGPRCNCTPNLATPWWFTKKMEAPFHSRWTTGKLFLHCRLEEAAYAECLTDERHGNKLLQVGKWLDLYHAEAKQLLQSIWISSRDRTFKQCFVKDNLKLYFTDVDI